MMKFTAVHRRRLRALAKLLRSLTPRETREHFYMGSWFRQLGTQPHHVPLNPTKKDLTTCGTSACALGWATTIPELQRAGLTLDSYNYEVRLDGYRYYGTYAAAVIFGLDSQAARWLVTDQVRSGTDETPKQVARRIDLLIANDGRLP